MRRATYDSIPLPYIVAGTNELYVVSTTDHVIGRSIFLEGEFDFGKFVNALAILRSLGMPPPRHLIDVGANIGSITIPALKRGMIESATAIEPHPENLRLLRTNLSLNGLSTRTSVLAVAIGNKSGQILQLEESPTNSGNHSIGERGKPVDSMALDDLGLPSEGSLLWMDIEGYEGHALEGGANLLATGLPVVCEFNKALLEKAGGIERFASALEKRTLFEISEPFPRETSFAQLMTGHHKTHTDILAC